MGKSKRNKQTAQAKTEAATQQKKTQAKRKMPIGVITVAAVAVLIVAMIVIGGRAESVAFSNGQASRIIATVDECAQTTLPITFPAGESREEVAANIFEALSTTEGVGLVTVFEDDPRVQIEYCQSYSSDPVLREVLGRTGYLAQ